MSIIVYLNDLVTDTEYKKEESGKATMYDYAMLRFHAYKNLIKFRITLRNKNGDLLINETYTDKSTKDKVVCGVIGEWNIDYEEYVVDRTNQRNSAIEG
jgi:hypothetical protein